MVHLRIWLRDGMTYCTSMPPVKMTAGTHPSLIVFNPTSKTGVTKQQHVTLPNV